MKWEYVHLKVKLDASTFSEAETINQYGAERWEIVSINILANVRGLHEVIYTFKRRIK